mmetsp:Transcript_1762/g.2474  ORF Transcript_1762/g.2474 Transcript_1762/m.2474 type:complete len:93 (-) Transcript_1762:436-714(-)
MISIVFFVSRSPVGSSSKSISGSLANALAIVTLCCSPPDNSDGKCLIRSRKPTEASNCFARALRSDSDSLPRIVMGNSTFSNADIVPIKLNV